MKNPLSGRSRDDAAVDPDDHARRPRRGATLDEPVGDLVRAGRSIDRRAGGGGGESITGEP